MTEITDFQPELDSFDFDILHIDDRLTVINKNIILLQSNVDRLTNLILSSSNKPPSSGGGSLQQTPAQDKTRYYTVQNEALKVLALYNDNYQRLLDLKYKYRTAHGEFKLKIRRFIEIELKKSEIGDGEISHSGLMKALTDLAAGKSSTSAVSFEFNDDEII
jgi:hypothetical protein